MASIYAVPAGTICAYGGANAPTCWLLCDGALYDVAAWPALYAAIANLYGGTPGNTFRVPDLRDRSPIGASPGALDTARPSARAIGDTPGQEKLALTESNIPLPAHNHALPGQYDGFVTTAGDDAFMSVAEGDSPLTMRNAVPSGGSKAATEDVETLPPQLVCNWIIKT